MRDPSNHRGQLCCSCGRSEGVAVFETGVAFHVAWERNAVFSGVRGQPRRCATCAESSDELELQARC